MTDLLNSPAGSNWQEIKIQNHHGINTPIFSLRSRKSSGIGEYLDLLPLIDWCRQIGFDVLQLLPINDSGLDPSPYNALSSKALHPIYISLHALPGLNKYPKLVEELNEFQELNERQRVDYLTVLHKKETFLKEYFNGEFDFIYQTVEYQNFLEENSWVEAYALFKYFKANYYWKSWQDWPKDYTSQHNPLDVHFHIFVQFLCFNQMTQVTQYAANNGIYLKGDIPILISPDSADVWYETHYFDLSFSSGSPPDFYNSQGQNWGFPLYNFEEQAKDNFLWWKDRLNVAKKFYHIYRLDHIVGFYRIWAIKHGQLAIDGQFIPEDHALWISQGEKLLKVLLEAAPSMLPIGEDLGVVPDNVRDSMKQLGIPGTKMMRWERKWQEGGMYIDPKNYGPDSLTTVSTHDSETLQLWWRNQPAETIEFAKFMNWHYEPTLSKEEHIAILKLSHHSGSLFHINLLLEYLEIFPELSWENLEDSRINVPGVINDRNWNYRYKSYLEDLIQHEPLKKMMIALIQ